MCLRGPRELESPWRALWRPFLSEEAVDGESVHVSAETWGYSVTSPGREVNVQDPWRALIESRNDAIRLGLAATKDVIDLHSAVLERDGSALFLLGDAWAGKTTMALDLVARGWRYFSDDLGVIELDTGLVRPVPKPPGVKAHPWDEMKRYWHFVPEHLGVPPGPFVIPPPFTGSLDERAHPAWFVFLEYIEGNEVLMSSMSQGEGIAQAGEHLGRIDSESFKALADVGRRCEHLRLSYGSSRSAAEELSRLLACAG